MIFVPVDDYFPALESVLVHFLVHDVVIRLVVSVALLPTFFVTHCLAIAYKIKYYTNFNTDFSINKLSTNVYRYASYREINISISCLNIRNIMLSKHSSSDNLNISHFNLWSVAGSAANYKITTKSDNQTIFNVLFFEWNCGLPST